MKGFIIISVLICLAVSAASGFDMGVILENQTGFTIDTETALVQKDTASLWIDTAIGERLSFTLKGSYTFDINRYFLMDVDVLKFGGSFPFYSDTPFFFGFAAGRIPFREFTDLILAHRADGLELRFGLPFMTVSVSAGYTGLMSKPRSSVVMTKTDLQNLGGEALFFASPRMIEKIDLRFLEVLMRQDLYLSFIFQQDLNPAAVFIQEGTAAYSETAGGRLDTYHFGLGFSGPVYAGFYVGGFGFFETGKTLSFIEGEYRYMPILAFVAGGEFNYYNRRWLNTNLGLRFVYSSGDADYTGFFEGNSEGSGTMFIPVSRPDIAVAFSPQLGNIFFTELHASFKPLGMIPAFITQNLQFAAKGIVIFRSTPGPISEPGIDPASSSLYLGTEIDGVINFRMTSDIGMIIQFGSFIPSGLTFLSTAPRLKGTFNFVVSI